MCAPNENEQPWRDDVHEALQQAWVVHGRDDANRWKQEQSVQQTQLVLM
jgi:hypothetical protein